MFDYKISPGLLEYERVAASGDHDGPDHPQYQRLQGGQGQDQEARAVNKQPQVRTKISSGCLKKSKKMSTVVFEQNKFISSIRLISYKGLVEEKKTSACH